MPELKEEMEVRIYQIILQIYTFRASVAGLMACFFVLQKHVVTICL